MNKTSIFSAFLFFTILASIDILPVSAAQTRISTTQSGGTVASSIQKVTRDSIKIRRDMAKKTSKENQGNGKINAKNDSPDQYLSNIQDTTRLIQIRSISIMLMIYYSDYEKYPSTPISGCVPEKSLDKIYAPKGVPKDPTGKITPGCDGSDGTYPYRSGMTSGGKPYYVLGSKMGTKEMGNSSASIETITPQTKLVSGSGDMHYIISDGI